MPKITSNKGVRTITVSKSERDQLSNVVGTLKDLGLYCPEANAAIKPLEDAAARIQEDGKQLVYTPAEKSETNGRSEATAPAKKP